MSDRELPDLQILSASSLVLHEETDLDRTARLTQVLSREQFLKNPPIVAPMPEGDRYVVLDGANRTTSLWALGVPHIIAQVVDYDAVDLDTWNHVVTEIDGEKLFEATRLVEGLRMVEDELEHARRMLTARRCLGYIVSPHKGVHILYGGDSLLAEATLLNRIVHTYRGIGRIHRIKTDTLGDQGSYYGSVAAVIVFPRFTPADIINLATMDHKLPTGITRHVIPNRALRVNYPLQSLADLSLTIDQKSSALREFVRDRLQRRAIRVYQESTVLYDE